MTVVLVKVVQKMLLGLLKILYGDYVELLAGGECERRGIRLLITFLLFLIALLQPG